jgi:iron complex outermembrane receptor protein
MDWNAFTLFVSGRYDWVDTTTVDDAFAETDQADEGFSGRVGLSYRTPWDVVFYGNYSTSFSPNIGVVYDDVTVEEFRPADPTLGRQKEIGVKYALPGTNAVISAALFDIEQQDGVVFDTSTGMNRQVQRDLHSRGFEIEANASFDNGLSLIASYTWLKLEIDKGAVDTEGNELSATPNHIASLWARYLFQGGPLEGLGLGAGLRYVGESYGDDENTIKNDDRIFVDAALSYDFGRRNPAMEGVLLQVNAKNILDKRKPICSAGYCYRDEGISVFGSLRYRF